MGARSSVTWGGAECLVGRSSTGRGQPHGRDAGVGASCWGGSGEERASCCGPCDGRVVQRYVAVRGHVWSEQEQSDESSFRNLNERR
jgi:hypothetical protein